MITAQQWNEDVFATISFATDPWLQSDGKPIDLVELFQGREDVFPIPDNECTGCAGERVPGAIAPINDEYGIEMCDECTRFDSDFFAADAVAHLISTTVPLLAPVTIWYFPSGEDDDDD